MTNCYAVMGNPVFHSLSPTIHALFAKQTGHALTYEKIRIDLAKFEQQVDHFFNMGGNGLNITLPCKQRAFIMSDEVTPRCLQAKAANTLWRRAGKLHADNTDGIGLIRDLRRYIDLSDKRILVLGAGGAVRGILGPLLMAKPAKLTLANRTMVKAQALKHEFLHINISDFSNLGGAFDVIINGTSASLNKQDLSLSPTTLENLPFCYDLAYQRNNPTSFVAWAQSLGCVAVDGLGMLVEQAAEAFFIWHGVMPDVTSVLNKGLIRA